MNERVGLGIIGAGRIGRVHARTLVRSIPMARVLAVADTDPDPAEALSAKLGIPLAVSDPQILINNPNIDAVLVCSPTQSHAALVEAALRAGKHVFCEKPLDMRLERIRQVLSVVEETGLVLQMGFNRRFDPDFAQVRQLLAQGAVGEPRMLRITSRDPAPPPMDYLRSSGGMFMDMTIHDFDMARFLMNSEVTRLHVMADALGDPGLRRLGDVDSAIIILRFENGALGVIENSRQAAYGYDQRVEILGSRGRVANRNHGPHAVVLSDSTGIHGPLPRDFFMERYSHSYKAQLEHFLSCISGDANPVATGQDALMAAALALAAARSLRSGLPVRPGGPNGEE